MKKLCKIYEGDVISFVKCTCLNVSQCFLSNQTFHTSCSNLLKINLLRMMSHIEIFEFSFETNTNSLTKKGNIIIIHHIKLKVLTECPQKSLSISYPNTFLAMHYSKRKIHTVSRPYFSIIVDRNL